MVIERVTATRAARVSTRPPTPPQPAPSWPPFVDRFSSRSTPPLSEALLFRPSDNASRLLHGRDEKVLPRSAGRPGPQRIATTMRFGSSYRGRWFGAAAGRDVPRSVLNYQSGIGYNPYSCRVFERIRLEAEWGGYRGDTYDQKIISLGRPRPNEGLPS